MLAVLVGFPIVWSVKRRREAEARRAALLAEHATLTASLAGDFRARRAQLLGAISRDVGPWSGPQRDASFRFETLASEPVLYGRVRVREVNDEAGALRAVLHRYPDQFTSCLGVQFVWARELLDKGSFLMPDFVDAVRGSDDADRLRALREDLLFRLRRDTETLTAGLRPRYFVLVVDEAAVSVDGPSRVFVHDLSGDARVLVSARGDGRDVVIVPFQIQGIAAPPPRTGTLPRMGVTQHDCSIANTLRQAFGEAPAVIENTPPTAPLDAGAPSDAARADAAHPADAR